MADTIKTIKSAGGDYSSFAGWDAGRAKNVASGDREIAECDAFLDSGSGINTMSASWGASGSGFQIIIRAAAGQGHGGARSSGYRLSSSTSYYTLATAAVSSGVLLVQGITIANTQTTTDNGTGALFQGASNNATFENCIFTRDYSGASGFAAVRLQGAATNRFINCLIYSARDGIKLGGSFPNALLYNCAIVSGGNAIHESYPGTVKVKNTYFHGTTCLLSDDGYSPSAFTSCRHSTSQSITGSTGSTAYSTANFTSVTSGSENLSLPSGSALIDAGTDLSADADYPFSTDILGNSRTGTWEVGPFNYAAASVYAPPPYRTQARRIAPLFGF